VSRIADETEIGPPGLTQMIICDRRPSHLNTFDENLILMPPSLGAALVEALHDQP